MARNTAPVKNRLLVPLLPCVPVRFGSLCPAAHGLIRGAAVGVVLLVGDDPRLVVQLQAGRAEVVAELVANESSRRAVVTYVRVSTIAMRCWSSMTCSVSRSSSRVHRRRTRGRSRTRRGRCARPCASPLLPLGHLAHALARGVVDVLGRFRRAVCCTTCCAGRQQLVAEVPLHHRQVRHASHVAVRVVGVGLVDAVAATRADDRAAQPVALACPARAGWARCRCRYASSRHWPGRCRDGCIAQDVADRVVRVPLGVAAHALPSLGCGRLHAGTRRSQWWLRRGAGLAEVLAPVGPISR